MSQQWTEIRDAIRSSDPNKINDAIDRIKELDRDQRIHLFDIGFDDLISIYEESDDGYVRQSVVRVADQVIPGLAVVFILVDEEGSTQETKESIKKRLDTAVGFLLETLQDDDGRVRQSAKRALKDVYRGYEALEDTETIAALASELDALAQEYEDKRHDHLLESKADAEFFLRPAGTRMIESIQQLADSHDRLNRD
jgi:hypothetical protein